MRLSSEELRTLANQFDVHLNEDQVSDVLEAANDYLSSVASVRGISTPAGGPEDVADRETPGGETSTRSWERAENDRLNAIRCRCGVSAEDKAGVLSGSTVGLKDNVLLAGVPMDVGSTTIEEFVPATDAPVASRILDAGGEITAKLTCDEFAASGRGTTGQFGPVRNPHDEMRTAGGSSGGSAAAVAAGLVDAAIGTDTGGSIRIPASFCGVVGLKPTYGLVPQRGVVENTYTQDCVGPICETVADAARLLEAVAGKDQGDPASLAAAGRDEYDVGGYREAVERTMDSGDLVLGVVEEGFGDGVTDPVADCTAAAVDALEDSGATVACVSIPAFTDSASIKNALSLTEIAAHWRDAGAPVRRGGTVPERYRETFARRTREASEDIGAHYKSKLLAGAYLLAVDRGDIYTRAQNVRESYRVAFDNALDGRDALLTPTMPGVPPRIEDASDPGFSLGRNTRPMNVSRHPAITLPCGTVEGLPVGLQLIGHRFGESDLLSAAAVTESNFR